MIHYHYYFILLTSFFSISFFFFFFNDTATTEIYTLSLHDALPISAPPVEAGHRAAWRAGPPAIGGRAAGRSGEHTSELQSPCNLVCRLLLEKKKKKKYQRPSIPMSSLHCVDCYRSHYHTLHRDCTT